MTQAETERLIGYMPIITRAPDITDWERQFCISITGRRKRNPAFQPSDKQIATMARIVDKFQAGSMSDLVEKGP